ncbi:MAG: glycosyltransferase family A protein [Actinomycetota bacterium]|nr:glycosyltransferase family A protein [Actinomycetota bacterium]
MIDFAVIIPTRNRPQFVGAAVDSVLRQTHPAREIVVVRDGPQAVVPGSLPNDLIRVLDRPPEGVAAARNAGVAATSAEWLCFLDDDDLWHPERLSAISDHIESRPGCAAAHAGWWSFSAARAASIDLVATSLDECLEQAAHVTPVSRMAYLEITGRSFDLLLERNRTAISTVTVRRDVFERAGGFPRGYTCAEDWVMAINVARYTEWDYCERRLSFIRKHPGNNTTVNPTNDLVTIQAIREVWRDRTRPSPPHRQLTAYAQSYRDLLHRAVWQALARGDLRIALAAYVAARDLLPRQRDRAIALIPPPVMRPLVRSRARRAQRSR